MFLTLKTQLKIVLQCNFVGYYSVPKNESVTYGYPIIKYRKLRYIRIEKTFLNLLLVQTICLSYFAHTCLFFIA